MKKRTRRLFALIVLVTIASPLDHLMKLLIVGPTLQVLLIEWDSFNKEEHYKSMKRGIYFE